MVNPHEDCPPHAANTTPRVRRTFVQRRTTSCQLFYRPAVTFIPPPYSLVHRPPAGSYRSRDEFVGGNVGRTDFYWCGRSENNSNNIKFFVSVLNRYRQISYAVLDCSPSRRREPKAIRGYIILHACKKSFSLSQNLTRVGIRRFQKHTRRSSMNSTNCIHCRY